MGLFPSTAVTAAKPLQSPVESSWQAVSKRGMISPFAFDTMGHRWWHNSNSHSAKRKQTPFPAAAQESSLHTLLALPGACPSDLPLSPVFHLEIRLVWMNYWPLCFLCACLTYIQFLLPPLKTMLPLGSIMSWACPAIKAAKRQLLGHCDPGSFLSYSPFSSLESFSVLHFISFPTMPYV